MKLKHLFILLVSLVWVQQLAAQNTVFTYQGRVTDNGTNFTGSGQFKFALVTSTNAHHTATATANAPSGGFITQYEVASGGNGYVTAPAVTIFGGGGSGATATAHLTGDAVTSLTVANPGDGNYTSAPTVLIAPPPANVSYTTYWSNDGTSINGSEPTADVNVNVNSGLFAVTLGDTTVPNMATIDGGLFARPDLQLRIWFNDGVNGFAVLQPTQPLTAAPYAFVAGSASNLLGALPVAQLSGVVAGANLPASPNFSGTVTANVFAGNGGGLTNVNAAGLVGAIPAGALGNAWKLGGNAGANPAGGAFLGTTDTNALELKVNGERALRIEYATNSILGSVPNIMGGFSGNVISNGFVGAVIGGGGRAGFLNRAGNHFATVVGGAGNTASGFGSTAMGVGTTASGTYATAMGYLTAASGDYSTAMGVDTIASGYSSTAMGYITTASGDWATAMGYANTASGAYATAMGEGTTASGDYSTAMGYRAKANHDGSFVWADRQSADFASTGANQFCLRASGGVRLSGDTSVSFGSTLSQKLNLYGTGYGIGIQNNVLYSRGNTFAWYVGGVHNDNTLNAGGGATAMVLTTGGLTVNGTFVSASDRNLKENFAPVRPREVLDKVITLPLSKWSYKEDAATRHLGPMAQDFYAAFAVGPDDKHIATVDESGVALAAIQGLNEKLTVELKRRDAENAELKARLEKLEQLMNEKNGGEQ